MMLLERNISKFECDVSLQKESPQGFTNL